MYVMIYNIHCDFINFSNTENFPTIKMVTFLFRISIYQYTIGCIGLEHSIYISAKSLISSVECVDFRSHPALYTHTSARLIMCLLEKLFILKAFKDTKNINVRNEVASICRQDGGRVAAERGFLPFDCLSFLVEFIRVKREYSSAG